MKHGSLFSGIGGFDLAATWMGWENVFHCEKNFFCRRVLQHYWPNAERYEEIREFKGEKFRGRIDVLSGGFPCQPFSTSGKRRGTADDRYLWPEMYRIIREIRPRWVVGENVHGLLNWKGGLVFDQVQADLEAAEYEIRPFVLPAAGVGAPHRRDRVWIIAYTRELRQHPGWPEQPLSGVGAIGEKGIAADAAGVGFPGWIRSTFRSFQGTATEGSSGEFTRADAGDPWEAFPAQSPICTGNDGLSARLDDISFSKWRKESIKGAGNAIVPRVALQIFKAIDQVEKWNQG
jgi:DNA (cytosine-5)-methyltransferase 1